MRGAPAAEGRGGGERAWSDGPGRGRGLAALEFLEPELHILLVLGELVLKPLVLKLQLLDLAGHLPDLVLEPIDPDQEVRRILRPRRFGQRHRAGQKQQTSQERGRDRPGGPKHHARHSRCHARCHTERGV